MSSSSGRSARRRRAPRCATAPGVIVVDHRADEGYVTPAEVGRRGRGLRQPHPQGPDRPARPQSVGRRDNLRKGAALNAVQIAELLARDYLQTKAGNGALKRSAG